MIDSIVISLNERQIHIPERIDFENVNIYKKSRGWSNESIVLDYNQRLKKKQVYAPSFEILRSNRKNRKGKHIVSHKLKIQVSLPKLLYGTNFFEIEPSDLNKITDKLLFHLSEIKIPATKDILLQGIVERVDFSKNLVLPTWAGRVNGLINSLSRLDYKQRSGFRYYLGNDNEGVYLVFYNVTQKFTVYDKLSEIEANGFTRVEQGIIDGFKKGNVQRDTIRFELSLMKKQSMEAVLRRYIGSKKKDFTLADIMSVGLAKNVLLDTFSKVYPPEMVLLCGLMQRKNNVLEAMLDGSKIRLEKKALLIFLVNKLWEIGEKDLRKEIKSVYGKNKYYSLRKEVRTLANKIKKQGLGQANVIEFIRQELENFELIIPKR
ncbi:hypothetical protein KKB83_00355 [Patescibacteria group bacterium]|nr:hypothetical protein [Patescibacteria group bacterium]